MPKHLIFFPAAEAGSGEKIMTGVWYADSGRENVDPAPEKAKENSVKGSNRKYQKKL